MDLESEVNRLLSLVESLIASKSQSERIAVLNQDLRVKQVSSASPIIQQLNAELKEEHLLIIKSLIAIGVWSTLYEERGVESYQQLGDELAPVEQFYSSLGGIVGYHRMLLSLLLQKKGVIQNQDHHYHAPVGIDISYDHSQLREFIFEGISSLPLLAEIYPVGGAADRLRLIDPVSADPLPAALLVFCGETLLEGLIKDLQAREYLYFKLFQRQVVTPVAMMTSSEKNNHEHLIALCREKNWFGRGKEAFRFFCQPLVPVVDPQGRWCLQSKDKLLMKPGGHGVLWKLAQDCGVLDWMQSLGREKMLVRQINNPIAGIDYGLLAFCGIGVAGKKQFGFSSCFRQVDSAEGVNVLIEKRVKDKTLCCLTNIEYCDFSKFSIQDVPTEPGGSYSQFPSNTNILFVDIKSIKQGIEVSPIPGMLINHKSISFTDEQGVCQEREVVRLESTMQNLADHFEQEIQRGEDLAQVALPTFLTHNKRYKTISTIKKMFQKGSSLLETPEGCFYDHLLNAHELLEQNCLMKMPAMPSQQTYIDSGPSFLFFCHPALGPLFSIIGQKIRRGKMSYLSELSLEIAEVDIEDLELSGVLQIRAERIMGEIDGKGRLQYSESVGRCVLHRVKILNGGIDLAYDHVYWKKEIVYKERCEIFIQGNGEFYANDVTLPGSLRIEVKSGMRMVAFEKEGTLQFREEPVSVLRESWDYFKGEDCGICLKKKVARALLP